MQTLTVPNIVPSIFESLARLRRTAKPQTGPLSVTDLRRIVAEMVD